MVPARNLQMQSIHFKYSHTRAHGKSNQEEILHPQEKKITLEQIHKSEQLIQIMRYRESLS